jgi:V/A-type H+-transporting ATPase subunit K
MEQAGRQDPAEGSHKGEETNMTAMEMADLGKLGGAMALTLSAIGSGLGAGVAAPAAIGAWKKCYALKKTPPFMLLAFIGAPLSQTIYGMIIMNRIVKICSLTTYIPADVAETARQAAAGGSNWLSLVPADAIERAQQALSVACTNWHTLLGAGLLAGAAQGLSAWMQGAAGAAAADALGETGQGAGNYLMALGIIETVAIFVLVFIGKVIG